MIFIILPNNQHWVRPIPDADQVSDNCPRKQCLMGLTCDPRFDKLIDFCHRSCTWHILEVREICAFYLVNIIPSNSTDIQRSIWWNKYCFDLKTNDKHSWDTLRCHHCNVDDLMAWTMIKAFWKRTISESGCEGTFMSDAYQAYKILRKRKEIRKGWK